MPYLARSVKSDEAVEPVQAVEPVLPVKSEKRDGAIWDMRCGMWEVRC